MNQLIKITQNNGNRAVSARELHNFLESKQQFADWIKNRIEEYGFIENEDFTIASQNYEANKRGGHNKKEYAISLDMAKELAMVEKTDKGRQARKYFIAIEKKAMEPKADSPKLSEVDKKRQLIALIRANLRKGDVKQVALELDVPYNSLKNVMRYNNFTPRLVEALYHRALSNKATALSLSEMINQLTL